MPDLDNAFEAEHDPFGFARQTFNAKITTREKLFAKLQEDRIGLFFAIYGQLSEESKSKVHEDDDWEDVYDEKDPMRLWIIVGATHQGGATGIPVLDRLNARNVYASLLQGPNEKCLAFKERTIDALIRLEAVEEAEVHDGLQAADFIHRLDNRRYAELKADLYNDEKKGNHTFPQMLTAAFSLATNYMITVKGSGGASHSESQNVFAVINADNSWKPRPPKPTVPKPTQASNKAKKVDTKKKSGGAKKESPTKSTEETRSCYICGKKGHLARDCPDHDGIEEDEAKAHKAKVVAKKKKAFATLKAARERDSDDELVLVSAKILALSANGIDLDNVILLDNQATASIFRNSMYLHKIRTAAHSCHIAGIGGSLEVTEVGDNDLCGEIWYHPDAVANVWSFDEAQQMYDITFDNKANKFFVHLGEGCKLQFDNYHGLYACTSKALLQSSNVFVNTVEANEKLYTPREVRDAKLAKKLMQDLGYVSVSDQAVMVKDLLNCPVTVSDVYRAAKIYGPDVASLK